MKKLIAKARKLGWTIAEPYEPYITCEYGGLHGICREFSIVYIEGYCYCEKHGIQILNQMVTQES